MDTLGLIVRNDQIQMTVSTLRKTNANMLTQRMHATWVRLLNTNDKRTWRPQDDSTRRPYRLRPTGRSSVLSGCKTSNALTPTVFNPLSKANTSILLEINTTFILSQTNATYSLFKASGKFSGATWNLNVVRPTLPRPVVPTRKSKLCVDCRNMNSIQSQLLVASQYIIIARALIICDLAGMKCAARLAQSGLVHH